MRFAPCGHEPHRSLGSRPVGPSSAVGARLAVSGRSFGPLVELAVAGSTSGSDRGAEHLVLVRPRTWLHPAWLRWRLTCVAQSLTSLVGAPTSVAARSSASSARPHSALPTDCRRRLPAARRSLPGTRARESERRVPTRAEASDLEARGSLLLDSQSFGRTMTRQVGWLLRERAWVSGKEFQRRLRGVRPGRKRSDDSSNHPRARC